MSPFLGLSVIVLKSARRVRHPSLYMIRASSVARVGTYGHEALRINFCLDQMRSDGVISHQLLEFPNVPKSHVVG
jgi:hypothetical protein